MIPNQCKVKICGTTSITDAGMAADAGADYSGVVVEVPFSERSVPINSAAEIARQTPISTVILVFDRPTDWVREAAAQIKPFAVQLLGHESPAEVSRTQGDPILRGLEVAVSAHRKRSRSRCKSHLRTDRGVHQRRRRRAVVRHRRIQ